MTIAPELGGLTLTVQHEDGAPVELARVALTSGPRHADLAALTNTSGRVMFAGLLPGTYEFAVLASGRRVQFSVVVNAGENQNRNVIVS